MIARQNGLVYASELSGWTEQIGGGRYLIFVLELRSIHRIEMMTGMNQVKSHVKQQNKQQEYL